MLNLTTLAFSEFAFPNPNSGASWITAAPDGNLWFIDGVTNSIGMFSPTTHISAEYPVSGTYGDGALATGPDGNLWFVLDSDIAQFNTATHAVTRFPIPAASTNPSFITGGPDGNVWFTDAVPGSARIGKVDLTTDTITEYPVSYANSFPQGITTGPDNNLWFADHGTHAIGLATLSPTMQPVKAPGAVGVSNPSPPTASIEGLSHNLVAPAAGTVSAPFASDATGTTLDGMPPATATQGAASTLAVSISTLPGATITKVNARWEGTGSDVATPTTINPPDLWLAPLVLDSLDLWSGPSVRKHARWV
jgi:hypothetical protein